MESGDSKNKMKIFIFTILRYKCCECKEFDLCQKCYNDGQHSQHKMIKILSPFAICTVCKISKSRCDDIPFILMLLIFSYSDTSVWTVITTIFVKNVIKLMFILIMDILNCPSLSIVTSCQC